MEVVIVKLIMVAGNSVLKIRKTFELRPILKDDLSKIFVSFDVTGLGGTGETALSISYTR